MNHKQFEEIPARSRQYSWYLRYNPLYMEVSMGQIIDVGFSIAMLPILLILYMEVFYNGTNHIIDVGCIAMLPQGSKACAELLRAQEGRPMFWRESSTGISVAAFFTARALGDSAWDRCDVRRKWAGYGWIYYTYATYVHQHVLIDVKICLSFFFGIESTEHLSVSIFSSWRVHHQQTGAELSRGNIFDVLLLCSTYVLYLDRKDAVFTEVDGNAGISKIQPKNI